jgi:hypothetical protein
LTIALIIASFAMLVFVILLFPVNISFNSVRSEGTIDGSLGVSWIIFLFIYSLKEKELKIHIFGRSISRKISPEKRPHVQEPERERKESGKMPPGKMPPRDFLNMTGPLLRLFKDFIYAFRIKYLDIEVTFGLNDPAHTGIITGFLHAIGLSRTGHNIRWRADFTGQTFDWDVNGKTALIPVRLIPPVARFIVNRQVLRYGWRIIRNQSNV